MADHHTWHHTTCFLAVKSEPWSPGQVSLMEFGAWVERLNRQTNLYEQESQIVETWGRGSRLQRQEAAGIVSIWTLGMELFCWYHWRSIGTINKIPQAGSSLASHIKNGKNIDVFSPEMAMLETKKKPRNCVDPFFGRFCLVWDVDQHGSYLMISSSYRRLVGTTSL